MREEAKNTKKLDNKGFSLIELIIVIAIMAILIGIVGTQVVPYIEKSKQAKDQQVLSGLLTSATTAFASNAELVKEGTVYSFKIDGTTSSTGTLDAKVINEFYELAGLKKNDATGASVNGDLATLKGKMTSKAGADIKEVSIQRSAEGVVTVHTVTNSSKYSSVFGDLSST